MYVPKTIFCNWHETSWRKRIILSMAPLWGIVVKPRLQDGQKDNELQLLVQKSLQSIKRFRLASVFFVIIPLSTPELILIVLMCKNFHCNVLLCIFKANFEIMTLHGAHSKVLLKNTTDLGKNSVSLPKRGWFCESLRIVFFVHRLYYYLNYTFWETVNNINLYSFENRVNPVLLRWVLKTTAIMTTTPETCVHTIQARYSFNSCFCA